MIVQVSKASNGYVVTIQGDNSPTWLEKAVLIEENEEELAPQLGQVVMELFELELKRREKK